MGILDSIVEWIATQIMNLLDMATGSVLGALGCDKGAVGQANINAKELQSIKIIIPPMDEQKQFLALVRQSDKSKFELEKALSELKATYKRIIKENLG